MSAEVSPDSKCPICLDKFNNISYLDLCRHKFCFHCIHEWSKNKAQCPLCKQPFNSIYHSINSEQGFKKYDLQPVENTSFGTFGGVRFRYRTTLTGDHRRTSSPPDHGVMFEASANPTQQPQDRYIRRMMRLAAERGAESEGRAANSLREQDMIYIRRELYRHGVRVQGVRDGGRSRDIGAEFFRGNPACLHRLIPWLKRELIVLYGAHDSLVNIVQHIIMSRITRYNMEDGAIQEELRPFLRGRTEHFLHEFVSFAKSPFNMEGYDQHAVYDYPAAFSDEDGSSSSSVIAISEDEEYSVELNPPGEPTSSLSHAVWDDETPGPSYSTTAEQGRAECLSVLDSDSSLEEEVPREFGASPRETSPRNQTDETRGEVNDEECLPYDSDDCVIISFVKPISDRTPELVQLSSDSDESASEDIKAVPLLPQHIRFSSLSPMASQSSDPSSAGQSENAETDRYHLLDSKERCSSSTSSRHKTSSKSGRKDRYRERLLSKDRDHGRKRRSRSAERRHSSRSPVMSHSSVSTPSRERGYSYSSGRDYSTRDGDCRRRDSDHGYQLYRHYSQEKNDVRRHYTERRSYYYSSSRSRSPIRDRLRRDNGHSRSRTYSSSRSPSTKPRPHNSKPGGKRKYKTRYLEETSKNALSNSNAEGDAPVLSTKHNKNSNEKRRKKSKDRSRKRSRSVSMELDNEEGCHERSKPHHKNKKRKKSRRHQSNERTGKHSSTVITIDSDSDSFDSDSVDRASSTNKDDPTVNSTTEGPVDSASPDSLA
ncbi:hypothetical protein VZT92_002918 [Zoarces viviparus]|uniref:E3 ubiquitin-protein ligase Topors n=1 Tax=Zoarces viviparus TaxID=48416 RepID=A0AAW1G296_ZOAVI